MRFHMDSTTHTKVVADFDETFIVCRVQNSKNNGRKKYFQKIGFNRDRPKIQKLQILLKITKDKFFKNCLYFGSVSIKSNFLKIFFRPLFFEFWTTNYESFIKIGYHFGMRSRVYMKTHEYKNTEVNERVYTLSIVVISFDVFI